MYSDSMDEVSLENLENKISLTFFNILSNQISPWLLHFSMKGLKILIFEIDRKKSAKSECFVVI